MDFLTPVLRPGLGESFVWALALSHSISFLGNYTYQPLINFIKKSTEKIMPLFREFITWV